MSYSLETIDNFDKELKRLSKKHRSIKSDILELGNSLQENPMQGSYLGQGCYKIRLAIASKGRGKSSGGRVIVCVQILNERVIFLSVYDKSEKSSISDAELEELLESIPEEEDNDNDS